MNILQSQTTTIYNLIHISDIHFTMRNRYEHYDNVFGHFVKYITKNYNKQDTIIIITGDLFNEKNKLDSNIVLFSKNKIYQLSQLFTTFIICGNHDFIQQNRTIPDTISSVFFDSKNNNYMYDKEHDIYYLKDTGYYIFNNIGFGVLSVFDLHDHSSSGLKSNIEFPNGDAIHEFYKDKKHSSIALLHTTVKNSMIQSHEGYERFLDSYDNHIDVNDIKNYDFILLGDIHKQQFINNAGYPSSLVQQNFGEDPLDHGFIEWNLKDSSYRFIRVRSDFAMIKCHLRISKNNRNQKQVNIILPQYEESEYKDKKVDLRVVIEKSEMDKYVDEKHTKDDLVSSIKKWFNDRKMTITNLELLFENEPVQNISEDEIVDDGVDWLDINTISRYIREVDDDEDLLNEYRKVHELVNIKKITNDKKNWKLQKLEWSNLFSYGEDNEIAFDKENINIILGENFSGKSSIIDVLIYTIYGSVYRCDKLIQIINTHKKSAYSSLTFQHGNILYKIERHLKKKVTKKNESHSQKIYVKKIVGNDISDIIVNQTAWTGEKLIETPDKIDDFVENVFGTKYNFLATYILNQNNNNSFVHMKNTERKEMLESWLNLELLEESRKQIKIFKKEKETEYNVKKGGLDEWVKILEKSDNQSFDEEIQSLSKKIQVYKEYIIDFENIEIPIKPQLPNIKYKNINYGDDFLNLINKVSQNINSLKSQYKDVKYDKDLHDKYKAEKSIFSNHLESHKKSLSLINEQLSKMKVKKCEAKDKDQLELQIKQLSENINKEADIYFSDQQNIIPHNRTRSHYDKYYSSYLDFLKNYEKYKDVDDNILTGLKTKRDEYLENMKHQNEVNSRISFLENKLGSIVIKYFTKFENVDVMISCSQYELSTYFEKVKKLCSTLEIQIPTEYVFIQYYENIPNKLSEYESIYEENYTKYDTVKNLNIDEIKSAKIQYEDLMSDKKVNDSHLKTLSKFTFSEKCECCKKNSTSLKYDKYKEKELEIYDQLQILNLKYNSYDNLCKLLIMKTEYDNFIKEHNIQSIKNDKLQSDYINYVELKKQYMIYRKVLEKFEYLKDVKKDMENSIEKENILKELQILKSKETTDYVKILSELTNDILDIEMYLVKYKNFQKELSKWEPFKSKWDTFEKMDGDYKINQDTRSKINEIYSELENFRKNEEYQTILTKKQYESQKIKDIECKLKDITNNIDKNDKICSEHSKMLDISEKLKVLTNEMDIMNENWSNYQEIMKVYEQQYQSYRALESEYSTKKQTYSKYRNDIIMLTVELDKITTKQKEHEIAVKTKFTLSKELYDITKLVNIYSKLNDIMSINGYNYWIYKNIIPILNKHTNDILKNIVDFKCNIVLTSENVKNMCIDIYVTNKNTDIEIPIKMTSGFQQQIVSIAIRISLIHLSSNKGSSIFMDESFSSFDVNYQSRIPELLTYFSKSFDNIWIISHIENLQKDIPGKYVVKRYGLYSQVKSV